ncbi:FAD-dependent monooxygenase [Sphingomonas sp. UYP23]
MADDETEVLVVGAGPAGLVLAAELKRLNVRTLLVERRESGANTSRAAVVHARTLEVLEGIGATPALLAAGIRVPTFRVLDRDRSLMEVSFAGLDTRYPFTLMCPQDVTEGILRDRLSALGGSVTRQAELISFSQSSSDISARVRFADGEREIRAKWLVGCDGAHSVVRSQAGIAFEGGSYDEDFVLADVRMDWPLPIDEVNLYFSPTGLMVVAPLPGDRFRIVATIADAPESPDAAFVQMLLDGRGPEARPAKVTEVLWGSRFHLQHRVTSAPRADRVLLCGDAAHVHSPAGGQGMNTGIQDAASLAEPLARTLSTGNDSGIDEWATRRHAVARDVVGMTDRMTRAATAQSTPLRLLRNALMLTIGHLPAVTDALARRLSELDYR